MFNKPWIKRYDDLTGKAIIECRECSKSYAIPVTLYQLNSWQDGELIQNIMPELGRDTRELFISGTCSECWDKMFGLGPFGSDGDESEEEE
jgi:hypothetical protein